MKSAVVFFLIALVALVAKAQPTKHRVIFEGITYDPDTVYASVGDTIEWEGDFTSHPLISESVATQRFPANAPPFDNDDGTLFQYVIKVPGEHAYYCVYHLAQGMVGTILVADAGIDGNAEAMTVLGSPNPASTSVEVIFALEKPSDVRITVFDLEGREVLRTSGSYGFGQNRCYLNVRSLPAGVYYYRLQTPEDSVVRKFTVVR